MGVSLLVENGWQEPILGQVPSSRTGCFCIRFRPGSGLGGLPALAIAGNILSEYAHFYVPGWLFADICGQSGQLIGGYFQAGGRRCGIVV